VTSTSKLPVVFVIAFGAVFAAAGLAFATALASHPENIRGNPIVGVVVCGIFILVGGGIIYGGIYGFRAQKELAAVEQSQPDSPWLWKKDWATGRSESRDRNNAASLWVAAIFWNAIVLTVSAFAVPKMWRSADPKVFFPIAFCLVGVALAVFALRATIRRLRFGRTYFEFASLPFSPGKPLRGSIHLRIDGSTPHGIDLTFSCIREVITGSGKSRNVNRLILWQTQANIPQAAITPGPMGDAVIPVDFVVPGDAYETNYDRHDDRVLWILHAHADVPGVDYADDFEVPIFRLSPAAEPADAPVFAGDVNAAPAFDSDPSDVSPPADQKVVVSAGATGGTEFYFPPFRNPLRILVLFLVTLGFGAIAVALQFSKAPWIFRIVFVLMDFLLIYGVIRSAFGSWQIEVGDGKLRATRALFGIRTARDYPFAEIDKILAIVSSQSGTNPTNATYTLRLQTKTGGRVTLADAIDNRQEARWVAAQLEKQIGLKLDTHVAVDNVFGVYGPPPQRGTVPANAIALRRGNRIAGLVALVFMAGWTTFIFYNIIAIKHAIPKRPTSGQQVQRSGRIQRVIYKPLTDLDIQRLQLLPEQSQAEELLDRAIQHDDRARDLFEQDIAMWPGGLQFTDRMKELERRSSYSTDLRVRYANVDLNLAIYGWAKTQHSADLLITQAQTDKSARAAAVYQMGMLAGRGIAYDLIYPVLTDYARNDPDAYVRQWAVEGIRYLGTDEALDQLFYSFTHDPSMAVRNRAGCNISDCGNFMRKQRMRMAPRLIALAADAQTSSQMRNWCFLALSEITDVHLPPDAAAWQRWYDDHGPDKMAEFEQMDWWRVRGDE